MGLSQTVSPYAVPSITISPPTSPREGRQFPKCGASTDLSTIEETETSTQGSPERLAPTNSQYNRTNLLTPEYTPPPNPKCNGEQSSGNGDELAKLKSMAERLKLIIRRPSYVEWCENLPKWRDFNWDTKNYQCDGEKEDWRNFKERRERFEEKIHWVRQELIEMKSQDHRLAIQLMRLRSEIQQLRLQRIHHEHRELIDAATECAHEDRDSTQVQPALCDPPFRGDGLTMALEKPLKDVGVTRLNLFARRFSLC